MRGWEQQELATRAGIARSVISRLERNLQVDFQFSVIAAVAKAFNVSVDHLLTEEYQQQKPDFIPELESVFQRLGEKPENIQRIIARTMQSLIEGLEENL